MMIRFWDYVLERAFQFLLFHFDCKILTDVVNCGILLWLSNHNAQNAFFVIFCGRSFFNFFYFDPSGILTATSWASGELDMSGFPIYLRVVGFKPCFSQNERN